jgi:hypothetical protein
MFRGIWARIRCADRFTHRFRDRFGLLDPVLQHVPSEALLRALVPSFGSIVAACANERDSLFVSSLSEPLFYS